MGEYESNVLDLSADEWTALGFGAAADAAGYVELGVYADGTRKIVPAGEPERDESIDR